MSQDYAEVEDTDSVADAAKKMKKGGATEALVASRGSPVGIVTERDILYKVVAAGSSPAAVRIREIMSSPVETVEETAKVGEAIAKMSKLGIRRLGVTRQGKVIGMVTQKAMVSGNVQQNVPLPELAPPGVFVCPYCGAVTKGRDELSVHIDHAHMGGFGLLQGDVTKW